VAASAALEGRRPQRLGRSSFEARLRSQLRMTGNRRQTPPVAARPFSRERSYETCESLPMRGEQDGFPLFPLHCQKRKREAERRQALCNNLRTFFRCGSAPLSLSPPRLRGGWEGARPPVGVPPRLSPEGLPVPKAQVQARLPGTRFPRALPAVACPSPVAAPHAPVVMPASMMPGPARERSVWLRARAPHPLHLREYLRERRPSMSRICDM